MGELLEFKWPYPPDDQESSSFSFDLGGTFRGKPLENESFVAEVKAYKKESDLPAHFRDFLAKCYAALDAVPDRCDHFLWISWAPFQAQRWDRHCTVENVKKSVLHEVNRRRVLGPADVGNPESRLLSELLAGVASRLWLITLSEKQQHLLLSEAHYAEIVKMITAKGRGNEG